MPSFGAATFWMNDPPRVKPLRPRGVPMLLACMAFVAGIVCARSWHAPMQLLVSLTVLLALVPVSLRWAPRAGWPVVLALWGVAGCWCAQMQIPIDRQMAVHGYADGLSRMVQGRVITVRSLKETKPIQGAPVQPLEPWQAEANAWEEDGSPPIQSVDLALSAIEEVSPDLSKMQPVAGGLRLTVINGTVPLHCGDVVQAPVRLKEPEVYRDPGAFSYTDWLLNQGVGATGTVRVDKVHVLTTAMPSLRCWMGTLQHSASLKLEALPQTGAIRGLPAALRLSREDTGMLAAMLFGDRTALGAEQRAGFERTGTFHLFVVSGLHVTLITGAIFWLLRRLRLPEFPAIGGTILLASAYALFTGFGIPAQRALAMSSLYLIARALDRQRSGLNALGVAALLMLAADPRALFEASFQMTALVIVAVAGIAVPLGERLFADLRAVVYQPETLELDAFLTPRVASQRVVLRTWSALLRDFAGHRWASRVPGLVLRAGLAVAQTMLFSAAIELCMALPMAVYFHRMVPLALPGNLLVAPLAVALAGSAAVTFTASLAGPWLAVVPAALTAALLHLVRLIVSTLGNARFGDLRVPSPPSVALMLCLGLVGIAIWALRARQPALAWCGALAAMAVPLVVLWPAAPQWHPGTLEVTAIDVGQGDSLLVVSPEGRTMLVDAGGPVGRIATKWDVGEQVVAPYLWSRRLRRLDAVLISHGHSDHIGGMPAVLRDLRPRELWLSLEPGNSPAMRDLLTEANRLGVEVHWLAAGDRMTWGGVQTTVLAPERTYANYGEARNDDSLVVRIDWQKASVLLEGDAEAPSEAAMVGNGRLQPVTLLKVGHHGSRTSTNPEFLAAVAPKVALISVGQHNTFGHPRWEVLERLEAAHVKTYRTDRFGVETVLLHSDGTFSATQAYN